MITNDDNNNNGNDDNNDGSLANSVDDANWVTIMVVDDVSIFDASNSLEKKIRLRWRSYTTSEIENGHALTCAQDYEQDKSTNATD